MYSVERKSEIITMLENAGHVDVSFLADKFGTSKETIRRDLREMEEDGIVQRTHGGAVLVQSTGTADSPEEAPLTIRGIQRFHEKNQICRKAASFIADGDIIFIDNSSTTMYLTNYIAPELHVTIVTNSIKVLLESMKAPNPNHILICLGGIFNSNNLSVYGGSSLKNAESYYPDKAFLSCAGISKQNVFADSSIYEIDTKRMMIERAPEVFMLVDHSKFAKNSQIFLCDVSAVNCMVTDAKTNVEQLNYLDTTNLKLIVTPE